MDDDAVITLRDGQTLEAIVCRRAHRIGSSCFAEAYIEGREFNLSLLAGSCPTSAGECSDPDERGIRLPKANGADGLPERVASPQILPPAEIDFASFPADRPHIVGYRAKWDDASLECRETPRRFEFPEHDGPLIERLSHLARRCWELFGVAGYARVDFRVDRQGQPWILEINANPCLSPDAGFAAAVQQAGMTYDEAIERILKEALREQENTLGAL
jgi:D-alanine-D-alanine ligase